MALLAPRTNTLTVPAYRHWPPLQEASFHALQDHAAAVHSRLLREFPRGPGQPIGADCKHDLLLKTIDCLFSDLLLIGADLAQFMAKAFLEKDYEAIKAQTAPQPVEDVVMGDAEPKVELATEKIPVDDHKVEPKIEEQPAVASTIPETHADTPIKEEKEPEPVPEEIDFDSVLNDNAGGPNDFDLNLDFGDDSLGNQAFLSGSTFDKAKPPDGDGGVFDLALQKDGDPEIMGESSFDDLFLETDQLGEGDLGQLEGDSLMNLNELDDNWFT